jgi:hypothetical protein
MKEGVTPPHRTFYRPEMGIARVNSEAMLPPVSGERESFCQGSESPPAPG